MLKFGAFLGNCSNVLINMGNIHKRTDKQSKVI